MPLHVVLAVKVEVKDDAAGHVEPKEFVLPHGGGLEDDAAKFAHFVLEATALPERGWAFSARKGGRLKELVCVTGLG